MMRLDKEFLLNLYEQIGQEEFAKMTANRAKILNQKIRRLEKKGNPTYSYGYRVLQVDTGKEKPRYSESASKYEKYEKSELINEYYYLQDMQTSNQLSIRYIEKKRQKGIEKLQEKLADKNIQASKKELSDFFENGGAELFEIFDSEQVLEDYEEHVKDGGKADEFIQGFKDYRTKTTFTKNYIKKRKQIACKRMNRVKQGRKRK